MYRIAVEALIKFVIAKLEKCKFGFGLAVREDVRQRIIDTYQDTDVDELEVCILFCM